MVLLGKERSGRDRVLNIVILKLGACVLKDCNNNDGGQPDVQLHSGLKPGRDAHITRNHPTVDNEDVCPTRVKQAIAKAIESSIQIMANRPLLRKPFQMETTTKNCSDGF